MEGSENKNGMSTEDVSTGEKMDSTFHKLAKRKKKQAHLHHEQKFADKCKVGAAFERSQVKKNSKKKAPEP